jgi:hypothetical protein
MTLRETNYQERKKKGGTHISTGREKWSWSQER